MNLKIVGPDDAKITSVAQDKEPYLSVELLGSSKVGSFYIPAITLLIPSTMIELASKDFIEKRKIIRAFLETKEQ